MVSVDGFIHSTYGGLSFSLLEGVLIGIIFGLIFKLATKVIKIFILVQFLIIKWLESRDILIVDWQRLTLGLMDVANSLDAAIETILYSVVETGIFGLGVLAGIMITTQIKK
jgi:uncharacterized membrane protein (Fun14 family)|tara:strand:+ start:388 stop:723 length:336 start_codon:yes stop_codon:yes gene_type:complete